MRTWYWKKENDRHYFVEAVNLELKSLASLTPVAGVKREGPSDLEAQIVEKFVPNLEKAVSKNPELKDFKYVVLTTSFGTVYDLKPKNLLNFNGIHIAFYKRRPKFLKTDKVVDYQPENYEPVKEAYRTPAGEVEVDRGFAP